MDRPTWSELHADNHYQGPFSPTLSHAYSLISCNEGIQSIAILEDSIWALLTREAKWSELHISHAEVQHQEDYQT